MNRLLTVSVFLALVSLACSLGAPTPTEEIPPIKTATQPPVLTEAAAEATVSGADSQVPIPLDAGTGTYKGLPLGLQDNGAPTITPVDGVIGLVCIGMSNAFQECEDFIAKLGSEFAGQVNPQVKGRSTRR